MAPILGTIIGTLISAILLLMCQRNWKIFKPSLAGYRDVFEFGAYSSAVVIVNVVLPMVAATDPRARILDFTAVGLYSRAVSITQVFDRLVLQVVNPVIMPAIAAHARAGGDLKKAYLDAVALIGVLHWPFLIFIALLADQIILVLAWIHVGRDCPTRAGAVHRVAFPVRRVPHISSACCCRKGALIRWSLR